MEELIDLDLKHHNPPGSDELVEFMLLGDRQYMMSFMSAMSGSPGAPNQRSMSIAQISYDPTHPFHKRIKNAFGYVNSRRKKAGLSLDKWPIPIVARPRPVIPSRPSLGRVENLERRLVWSLNRREVCAARGVFKRYLRDGLIPFLVDSDGQASRQITTFNPASCEVLFKS